MIHYKEKMILSEVNLMVKGLEVTYIFYVTCQYLLYFQQVRYKSWVNCGVAWIN